MQRLASATELVFAPAWASAAPRLDPAGLTAVDGRLPPDQRLTAAVEANVRWSTRQFLDSPEGQARMAERALNPVGAVYEPSPGRVRFRPGNDVDYA